jgi:hypothetical protein
MEMNTRGEGLALADETLISRTGDWLSADTGDGVVMMSPSVARYIGVSPTGGAIWELLATPQTLGQICERLQQTYDTSGVDLRGDVVEFVSGLVARGALALG